MPIYEFYCAVCHTVFSFFSPQIDTEAAPACPRCGRPRLPRKPSTFATLRRTGGDAEEEGDDLFAGLDEERLEGAMDSVLGELEGAGDDEDPRQVASVLRRFSEAAGMEPGPRMEEMLRRLEAGEDPDSLEEEMGELGDDDEGLEDFFRLRQAARGGRRKPPPRVDKELYFL